MNEHAMQVAMILDRSGSMSSIEGATVEGMNSFIAEQQRAKNEAGADIRLLLVQFDDRYEQVFSGPVADAPMLTLAEHPVGNQVRFVPRGSTALLDAMGRTIDEVGKTLSAIGESQRPAKVVIVTMTDGEENHSSIYSRQKIAEMIGHQREVYKWEFQFLAANQDAISTASALNIPLARAITYTASAAGARNVMASVSRSVRAYATVGAPAPAPFSDQDRQAAIEDDPGKPAKRRS